MRKSKRRITILSNLNCEESPRRLKKNDNEGSRNTYKKKTKYNTQIFNNVEKTETNNRFSMDYLEKLEKNYEGDYISWIKLSKLENMKSVAKKLNKDDNKFKEHR